MKHNPKPKPVDAMGFSCKFLMKKIAYIAVQNTSNISFHFWDYLPSAKKSIFTW